MVYKNAETHFNKEVKNKHDRNTRTQFYLYLKVLPNSNCICCFNAI